MTTLIPKFDFKNGGATPADALNRAINLKLADTVAVSDFDGADAGAKIIAAIASLPATGGVVDGTMLQGIQVISSTISIGSSTRPVTLLLSHGATFQPSSASVQMFRVRPNGQLIGATIDTTNVTYAERAVLLNDLFTDGQVTLVQDLNFNGTISEGTALELSTSGATVYGIAFVTVNQIKIIGYAVGLNLLSTTAGQFINGNSFNNIQVKSSPVGFSFSGAGAIDANQFMSCTYQAGGVTSIVGFNITIGQYNTFLNTNIWDMPAGGDEYVFAVGTIGNNMSGYVDSNNATDNGSNTVVGIQNIFPVLKEIQSFITPDVTWGLNFAPSLTQSPNLVTFLNGTTYDIAQGSGIVVLHSNTTGDIAMFLCAANVTTLISNPSSVYSATLGTASKINFGYNGGTTSYRIQNASGLTQSIYISLIKTGFSN
jgi:hypothetical protein